MTLDWQFFLQDDGAGRTYLEWMFEAWRWTLAVAGGASVVALASGCLMGTLRTLPQNTRLNVCLAQFARAWVELFRNIPVLLQILLWYFVLPKVFPAMQQLPGFALVVLGLGFFTSARVAEMLRAGIEAIPQGQRYAALAMGFSTWQTYRYVLLPIAFRTIWPPLTSETMSVLKNSSVAFAVSIAELTMYAMQVQEETSRGIEVYLAVTAMYALSSLVVNRAMVFIERRLQIPGIVSASHLSGGH